MSTASTATKDLGRIHEANCRELALHVMHWLHVTEPEEKAFRLRMIEVVGKRCRTSYNDHCRDIGYPITAEYGEPEQFDVNV